MTAEQKVSRAALRAAEARERLDAAIREARAEGLPLRTIAEAAGMSHEHVRRVVNTATPWTSEDGARLCSLRESHAHRNLSDAEQDEMRVLRDRESAETQRRRAALVTRPAAGNGSTRPS